MEETMYLRVHSKDLHEHIAQEVGECLETGLYTDLMIRCQKGVTLHAHKIVLAAISPYMKMLLSSDPNSGDIQSLEFPDLDYTQLQRLLEVIYNGSVEATMDEMRSLIVLAHSLYISIPLSEELINMLNLKLPILRPLTMPQISVSMTSHPPKTVMNFMNMKLPTTAPPPPPPQPPPPLSQQKIFRQGGGVIKLPQTPADLQYANPLEEGFEPKRQKLENGSHEFLCPICNSTYSNMGNFKQHMRRHENENSQVKEERMNQINEMVTTSFNPVTSQYTCQFCKSTYSHPGNFKQHLLKHERDTNGVARNKSNKSPITLAVNQMGASGPSGGGGGGGNNNHLTDVLQSALADRVDNGDRLMDSNVKMYECQHCGRTFKHPGNFKQHLSSHMRLTTSLGGQTASQLMPMVVQNPPKTIFKPKPPQPELPKMPNLAQMQLPRNVLNVTAANKPHFLVGTGGQPPAVGTPVVVPDQPEASPIVTRWKCNHCTQDLYFQSREKLRQHVAANHRGPNAYKRQTTPIAIMPLPPGVLQAAAAATAVPPQPQVLPAYHECNVCHQVFESEVILSRHMSTHQTKEEPGSTPAAMTATTAAPQSSTTTPTPSSSSASTTTGGPNNEMMTSFHCDEPDCYQSFSKEGWLVKHKENFHGISPSDKKSEFECKICKKTFQKMNKLTAHMKIHSAPEDHYKYPCDVCGKRFTRPQHVNRHKLLHTGERPFKCDKCDKSFAREDKLKIHVLKECEFRNNASSGGGNGKAEGDNTSEGQNFYGWASCEDESGDEEIVEDEDDEEEDENNPNPSSE